MAYLADPAEEETENNVQQEVVGQMPAVHEAGNLGADNNSRNSSTLNTEEQNVEVAVTAECSMLQHTKIAAALVNAEVMTGTDIARATYKGNENVAIAKVAQEDNATIAGELTESSIIRPKITAGSRSEAQNINDSNKKGIDDIPSSSSGPKTSDLASITELHALAIIDGTHLISEEGLDLWGQHFAPTAQSSGNPFKIEIPVSWFNFIIDRSN